MEDTAIAHGPHLKRCWHVSTTVQRLASGSAERRMHNVGDALHQTAAQFRNGFSDGFIQDIVLLFGEGLFGFHKRRGGNIHCNRIEFEIKNQFINEQTDSLRKNIKI